MSLRPAISFASPASRRALLAEALVLGAISVCAGVLLTLVAIPVINTLAVPGEPSMRLSIAPDIWLLGYATFLGATTTIASGLLPALHATRVDVSATLQEGGTTRSTGRMTLRHAFVVGQVALSAFLLILSVMSLRTAMRGTMVDPGFDIGSGAVVSVALPAARSAQNRLTLARELTTRLAALPGVRSASVAAIVPLAGDVVRRSLEVRGRTTDGGASVLVNTVGPRYFETMGIALTRGREFTWTDGMGSGRVAIVSEAFVTRYFNADQPMGSFIRTGDGDFAEIVGVAADTHNSCRFGKRRGRSSTIRMRRSHRTRSFTCVPPAHPSRFSIRSK